MLYFCADDYGLNDTASLHIRQCVKEGVLNKVSVFPNFGEVDLHPLVDGKPVRISLHLNLVEGKCMADPTEIDLIADKEGNLKHAFGGLFKLNLLHGKRLEEQAYKEILAQVRHFRSILPQGTPFCIDSHQHTYMIPAIFNAMLRVLRDEQVEVEHMRIPAEPLSPFLSTPSLYLTYSPINLIKQWLLKFLWLIDKKHWKRTTIPTSYFFGILFSGKMDEKRVRKILPKYVRLAEKTGREVEILFHPGYLDADASVPQDKNVVFEHFYVSENRKTEFDCVMKLAERSGCNAVYRAG